MRSKEKSWSAPRAERMLLAAEEFRRQASESQIGGVTGSELVRIVDGWTTDVWDSERGWVGGDHALLLRLLVDRLSV